MLYIYVLENKECVDFRDNSPLFLLIKDFQVEDDFIYIDSDTDMVRPELSKLIDIMQPEDKLAVRSVMDMANSLSGLLNIFEKLSNKKITLFSCVEPFLCGTDYLDTLNDFTRLYVSFEKKKQVSGYRQAVNAGAVGRPIKSKEVEKALSMYNSGKYKISQIEAMTGISKTTLYRWLKNEK